MMPDKGSECHIQVALFVLLVPFIAYLFWSSTDSIFIAQPNIDGTPFDRPFLRNGSDEESSRWTLHDVNHVKSAASGACVSLKQVSYYYPPSSIPPPSPSFVQALRNQERLQKRCVNGVKNWTAHFNKLESGFEDCKYVVWLENEVGLGNRFLSIMSAFTYSLLTNRTLLLDYSKDMKMLLCDPFPETSWWLPPSVNVSEFSLAPYHTKFAESLQSNGTNETNKAEIFLRYYYTESLKHELFFCEYVQAGLQKAGWLSFLTDQYLIPGFYLIPSFKQRLKTWFPNYLVSPYLARYLLHPRNSIWDQITRVYQTYFTDSDLRIGVQVRTFGDYDPLVSQRILGCLNGSGIFPALMTDEEYKSYLDREYQLGLNPYVQPRHPKKKYFMLITSLYLGYYDFFRVLFKTRPTKDRDSLISIHSESHDSKEIHSLDRDKAAVVELWLLSMADVLFKSDDSTFGYIARALGSRPITYSMNICDNPYWKQPWNRWETNNKSICMLTQCSDTCFHAPPNEVFCPGQPALLWSNLSSMDSHIRPCEDVITGIALYPD